MRRDPYRPATIRTSGRPHVTVAVMLRSRHERQRNTLSARRRCGRHPHRSRAARSGDRRTHGREGVEHAEEPGAGRAQRRRKFIARGVAPDAIEFFAHGTTITTNALLEMRGAKVGLLITKGYRAVQEVQNQARDGNLFDYFYAKPQPIAPQSLTRKSPSARTMPATVLVAARSRRGAPRRARAEGCERRVDRGLLPVLVHESGARGSDAQDHPGGIPRRARVAVERGAAAHPRMVAALDDAAQCLPRAGAWCVTSTTSTTASMSPASKPSSAS